MKKIELVAAMWPREPSSNLIGDGSFYGRDKIVSGYVQLRRPELVGSFDQIRYIKLYVWWDTESNIVSLDLRVGDVHSSTEEELAALLKDLRGLRAKLRKGYPDTGNFVRGSPLQRELSLALRALGVTRAIQFGRGIPDDTYVTLEEYVEAAVSCLSQRKN